jgi:hypothetical protein
VINGWQGIDSAPQDGTEVLVLVEETNAQFVAHYEDGDWVYATTPIAIVICDATHWKYLGKGLEH